MSKYVKIAQKIFKKYIDEMRNRNEDSEILTGKRTYKKFFEAKKFENEMTQSDSNLKNNIFLFSN